MTKIELEKLHTGHVIKRLKVNEKYTVAVVAKNRVCEECLTWFPPKTRMVKFSRGTYFTEHTCFDCWETMKEQDGTD